MTLPISLPLSMSDIATEIGRPLPLELGSTDVRVLCNVLTGPISIADALGKQCSVTNMTPAAQPGSNADARGFNDGDDGAATFGTFAGTVNGVTVRRILDSPGLGTSFSVKLQGDRATNFFRAVTINGATFFTSAATQIDRNITTTQWVWSGSHASTQIGTLYVVRFFF